VSKSIHLQIISLFLKKNFFTSFYLGRSNGQKVVVVHNYGHSSHGKVATFKKKKKKKKNEYVSLRFILNALIAI
jgi:acetylglutamate kinase